MRRRCRSALAVAVFVLLFAINTLAQQPATGFPPFGSFSGGQFDTVNNANLNVHFAIPIVNKAGRGLPFSYGLSYDSLLWSPESSSGLKTWTPDPLWGWHGTEAATQYSYVPTSTTGAFHFSYANPQCRSGAYYVRFYDWVYTDPQGTEHSFGPSFSVQETNSECPDVQSTWGTAVATDGSGYSLCADATNTNQCTSASPYIPAAAVTAPSGVTFSPYIWGSGKVTDTNGNTILASATDNYTDTLGTTPVTVSDSSPPSGPITYQYQTTSGPATVTAKFAQYTVETHFGCSGITEFGATQQTYEYLVSEIDLPDQTRYTFNYEPTPNPNFPDAVTGRIASVTLPTGGTITYVYSNGPNDGINCADGTANSLVRTATPGGPWNYTESGAAPSTTTTLLDPQGNQTIFDFQGLYETERKIYQGSSTLLETVNTSYTPTGGPPFSSVAVTTVHNDDNLESEKVTDLNAESLPTEVDEYGYGQNAAGALARETLTCYASLSNPHILDRPSAVVVYGTSGNPADCSGTANEAARTGFQYDGNGNLTTLTEYVTPASSISRSFSYGSYGVLTGATDFKGTWTYFTNPTCSGAFPTSINQPMSLTSSLAWNCNTGLVTSVTDPNNQPTTFTYDAMFRPLNTGYPGGGEISMAYNDVNGGTWSAVKTTKLNSSQNRTDSVLLDGLGRVTQTQLNSDPAGPVYVDTTYDSLGRVASVTNPYRTNWATGGDTYTYDALGRVTNVKHADNNSRSISYGSGSPNCSAGPSGMGYPELMTDEAGHQRRLFIDAFGQIVESDEPDPNNGNAFDWYVCSTYDALGNLTNAAQWIQPRSYTYDMLSRVTSADNAESGTTYYSYTSSGGGPCSGDPSEPCTRTDANHVTTTYTYDALNRLTSKSYTDGTPAVTLWYDYNSATFGNWTANGLTNTKGRLYAIDTSGSPGSPAAYTGMVYSYDSMGRITNYWQCTPYNCGSSAWQMTYNYDLAGDVTSWTHPGGFTITNTINGAQQVTQIQNSPADSTHPQYLAQNITYNPWGAEQTLTNGCAGSGCTNTVETYVYNNRLQPVEIELGTTSNASADYCLVYNYYPSVGNPSSCSTPSQGTGDNGDVLAFLFQDNANSSYFSRTESYTYDALDRLTSGVAVGNNNGYNYNLTYVYDSFGNMTCQVNGQTDGYCANWTYNGATNQFTMAGFGYDADGNLTSDGSHTYQYDAEGRMISIDNGSTAEFSYNALGWRVFWGPGSGISYWHDASGQAIGGYTTGGSNAFIFWGGRELAEYEADGVYLAHPNVLNSVVQDTNWAGAAAYDLLINPWGQTWTDAGPMAGRLHEVFGGIQDYDPSLGQYQATFRKYNPGMGRWFSPDPLGGDITNPQSLNRYAYALNNPTTLTDPLGLDGGNPLCGNLYDWPGGSYEGSAPSEDCGLDSYPFIPPTFPPIGVIIGAGATSTAPPAPNPASPSSAGGEEFRRQPIPCVNVSALAAALTIQLAAALGVPPSSITLSPAGSKGGAADFSVTPNIPNATSSSPIAPTNLPYVNNQVSQVLHPGEHSQFWFPAPKDSVPGLGHTVHVLFNAGSASPSTGLPTISRVQVHVDIGNPMTAEGGVNPLGAVWHGVADVAAMSILSTVEGCPLKFQ